MATYIIAEAGVNHNGSIDIAKKLAKMAKEAGCDCIKFQVFNAEKLVTRTASKAKYQIENTRNNDTQFEMLKKLELREEQFVDLKKYCDDLEIDFLATPFDEEAVDLLEMLGVTAYKISSGDITNKPLLEYIAKKKKKVLLSTGMSTMEEVRKAVEWIRGSGNDQITLFHCTSNYPAPYDSVNMRAMQTLRTELGYPVGYSDHTEGIEVPLLAVAYGAEVIEKHFTYDKNAEGPDHRASLDFNELIQMVKAIRHIEVAMGNGEKKPSDSELSTRDVARKSLVWKRSVKAGTIITNDDICCKRPGNGIMPERQEELIGKTAAVDCTADTVIQWNELE